VIISCGPNEQNGNGGHAHNDKLSFELCVDGEDIIVDPGTYTYTADPRWRNKFRSTAYHNTVEIDGEEQNRFCEDELFRMNCNAVVRVNNWETNAECDILEVEHTGYQRLKDSVIHRRRVVFNKMRGCWIIKDVLIGEGKHRVESHLHFAPLEVKMINTKSPKKMIEIKGKKAEVVVIFPNIDKKLSMFVEQGWVSPCYGEKLKAPTIKYCDEVKMSFYFQLLIDHHAFTMMKNGGVF